MEAKKGRGGKSIHFLKALLKTNSVTDLSRSWLWKLPNYLAPKITTSRHMRRNEYSLKMNVSFYLKAETAELFSIRDRSLFMAVGGRGGWGRKNMRGAISIIGFTKGEGG